VTNVKTAKTKPRTARRTAQAAATAPRILLFGDSHSHAIQRAIEKRKGKGQATPLSAHRLLKEKNGRNIGDTPFEDFLESIRRLAPTDVVLSMIGGNQHSVFSLIQHPRAFDFFTPEEEAAPDSGLEVVPYRALEDVFAKGLRGGDGKSLEALRKATPARVVHIIPPPPKSDNAFIQQYHETHFARDLPSFGVSPPQLRLKFWRLQTRVLAHLCAEFGIKVMMPPKRTLDDEGFLRPEYYAQDATHGNWRYGERVLRDVERRYLKPAPAEEGHA
jgi:hypothetical protein